MSIEVNALHISRENAPIGSKGEYRDMVSRMSTPDRPCPPETTTNVKGSSR